MGIFDFLFKKTPKLDLVKNYRQVFNTTTDEDGIVHNKDYIEAKTICSHLKVSGTKYYPLGAPANYATGDHPVGLYLRCRYFGKGKTYVREPLKDLLANCPAVVGSSAEGSDILVSIDLEKLLKGNIDYILVDKVETTGEIFYYYSFKGLADKDKSSGIIVKGLVDNNKPSGTIEGYLVLNGSDTELVEYLCNLM